VEKLVARPKLMQLFVM